MTVTSDTAAVVPSDLISATIDDIEVQVPKGTLIIRAAEQIGIEIPRFCDHPLLDPVAACRMCLIEIQGMPKPQPACAIPLTDGMVVRTQLTSTVADVAQKGVMEFLLINHPLDCPICDKGGECPLQNQAMTAGRGESRFTGTKRTFPKPINVSAQILLDRERCVSCARCTRFADQIAGDAFIELLERGAKQQVGIAHDTPFDSYFSGNTVQICPVGALTSADYRFRSRPFDLVSTPSVCEHCASGCALRTDTRRSVIMRRLAGEDPEVNEDWNCDKGRFAFPYLFADRLTVPRVKDADGSWHDASWPEAISVAAAGLAAARGHAATLIGSGLTTEEAYSYAKFTRVTLGSDDIDFRSRVASDEERQFLASHVAGAGLTVTYADLEHAPVVVLVGLEPEEESPIVFLRLRKAAAAGTEVVAIAPWASGGYAKCGAEVVATVPGDEPAALRALADDPRLAADGAVILAGERLAGVPGGFSAAVAVAEATGAALAWVPRGAGERGALDAGALAGVLPGGRSVADPGARAEVAAAWGLAPDALVSQPGRDVNAIVAQLRAQAEAAAAEVAGDEVAGDEATGEEPSEDTQDIRALVLAGVDYDAFADPEAAREAVAAADFVVQLTPFASGVDPAADVVLPVRTVAEKPGSFTNWEGRRRQFGTVFRQAAGFTDAQVLALIAREVGHPIGSRDDVDAAGELAALGDYTEERPNFPASTAPGAASAGQGEAILATWRQLLDDGAEQAGEPHLAATARPSVTRLSAGTAATVGVADGDNVTVATDAGAITLPVELTDMPDGVVWLPAYSAGSHVHDTLRVTAGAAVRLVAEGESR